MRNAESASGRLFWEILCECSEMQCYWDLRMKGRIRGM